MEECAAVRSCLARLVAHSAVVAVAAGLADTAPRLPQDLRTLAAQRTLHRAQPILMKRNSTAQRIGFVSARLGTKRGPPKFPRCQARVRKGQTLWWQSVAICGRWIPISRHALRHMQCRRLLRCL